MGGMTAVRRAESSITRAWTMGWETSSRRSLPASSLSTTCRFSSTVVGSFRPCRRPVPSMKVTLGPSMKTSSTSERDSKSVRGP